MHSYPNSVILVRSAPAVPGLTFRRFRHESDFPQMLFACTASEAHDGEDNSATLEILARNYTRTNTFDPSQDVIVADVDGQLVGYARVHWWPEINDGPFIYESLGFILPEWRRRGIGRAMLDWLEHRSREIAAGHPEARVKRLQAFASLSQIGRKAMLEQSGYLSIRHGNSMLRPSLESIPDFPMPEGLEVRPARPEHFRAIWDAANEAFRDHWGAGEQTEDDFQEWLTEPVLIQPSLWSVAWDMSTNQAAGQVRTFINAYEDQKYNRKRGYTEFISVGRPWRKQGLARALISLSLKAQRAQGMTQSALGVDNENVSGATRIYNDCGFHIVKTTSVYRKTM